MSEALRILYLPGKDISDEDLSIINAARRVAFGLASRGIEIAPGNDEWEKLYFLAKRDEALLAFARIHDVGVTFLGKKYQILGIGTLVALPEAPGAGRQLALGVRDYIRERKQTGLAFCTPELARIYQRFGMGRIEKGQDRFFYPGPTRFASSDAVYISGKDGLIERMLERLREVAHLSRPHW